MHCLDSNKEIRELSNILDSNKHSQLAKGAKGEPEIFAEKIRQNSFSFSPNFYENIRI